MLSKEKLFNEIASEPSKWRLEKIVDAIEALHLQEEYEDVLREIAGNDEIKNNVQLKAYRAVKGAN
jgi:hypothetical protein